MTAEQKIVAVELALEGWTRAEMIAEVRALAGASYQVGKLEPDEYDFLGRAENVLGQRAFQKYWEEEQEEASWREHARHTGLSVAELKEQCTENSPDDNNRRAEYAQKFYGVNP